MTDREVLVTSSGAGYAQRIEAGRHVLASDEPVASGGTDTGPDPYALLLAALGACTSMTLVMYAKRKGWPLEGVSVRLSHDHVHARDCAECETRDGCPRGPLLERDRPLGAAVRGAEAAAPRDRRALSGPSDPPGPEDDRDATGGAMNFAGTLFCLRPAPTPAAYVRAGLVPARGQPQGRPYEIPR